MFDLAYAATAVEALDGAHTAAFLAPERCLRAGWLDKAAKAPWARLLTRAAGEAEAGAAGTTVRAENPDDGPAGLLLVVLPDERSRHNCPARPEEIAAALAGAGLDGGPAKSAPVAVVACAEARSHVLPIARAVGRALPRYDRRSKAERIPVRLAVTSAEGRKLPIPAPVQAVVDRARLAAELVDTPAEDLTTTAFVSRVRAAAKGIPHLRVRVITGDALRTQGLGGLHAVGRTAVHPPRLLLLAYRPPDARRTLGFVGKGVVYDTGGLNLKVGGHMANMKCDMGGAAAAVCATLALAEAGHRDAIVCAAGLVENAIGPHSYRPDDILTMHSGKTVEVNNTDAEGRLVLADACSFLARKEHPDVLIDLATLTGAQLVATGHRHAGIVSNRAGLEAGARAAGLASGDLAFPMPFAPEFFQREFRSKVADMKNSVADRMNAQSSCAAQFVYGHVEDLDLPWLHVDLAGPAFRDERGTGYGVALLATLARTLTKKMLAD